MTANTNGWDRSNGTLEERRRDGECSYCGSGDNLSPEVIHGDPATDPVDWICAECRDQGRGMK